MSYPPPENEPGPPQAYWPAGMPAYPGSAMPYLDPRFDPADPLASADFAGWWRRGFAVVRRGWRTLALVQVLTAVAGLVLLVPAQLFVDLSSRDLSEPDGLPVPLLAANGLLMLATCLELLIYLIGTLVAVRVTVSIATGADMRVGQAVRAVLPRVPALIGWSLLTGLITFAAVLACILPVFYVGAVFVVLPVVVLFERGNAVSRCFSLFHNDLGAAVARIATIAGLGLAISLPFIVGSVALSLLLDGTAFTGTGGVIAASVTGSVLDGMGSLICGVVLTPLIVATYADLRARREPFSTAWLNA
ncbi:hypothetical protein ACFQFC_13255 [Amorphoplanes digitatis]|uniref:Glycerophosphoryl diester phosphodiesterase membrane domain-containing protein n=1 Tax=Actinoplanes digitatis TaxID=1868 RepID=A0A7W7MT28_9ACTN|nr:hypothetical protein [Actinoplanes digitatis]MBB4765169.1 hypothetical protein [Actinoplanes digitatis]GID94620.1 hypothetical protein Adi01nite_40320 [Actinoplanes digitatis]